MPLFGKKNKNNANSATNDAGLNGPGNNAANVDNNAYDSRAAVDGAPVAGHHHHGGATGRGGAGNVDGTNQRDFAGNGPNTGRAAAPAAAGPGMNQGSGNNPTSDPYNQQAGANVPPAAAINQNPGGRQGGTSLTGRAEQAVGAMVGSQALKDKGYQKEQEANAYKSQSAEIAEAERLEHEAQVRRERAVAHGAHPANRALGGVGGTQGVYDGQGGAPGAQGQY